MRHQRCSSNYTLKTWCGVGLPRQQVTNPVVGVILRRRDEAAQLGADLVDPRVQLGAVSDAVERHLPLTVVHRHGEPVVRRQRLRVDEADAVRRPVEQPRGQRNRKLFQFLVDETGVPHLDWQISTVTTMVRAAIDKEQFKELYGRAFNRQLQVQGRLITEAPKSLPEPD